MNQDNKLGGNDCGICCAPTCPPRERPPIPSIGKPFEAPCTSTCLCGPKMCSIFGGHDYNAPGPDPKACSPRKLKNTSNVNSLGAPVGVLTATIAMKSNTPDVHPHRYATSLIAFMKVYTTPEHEWTEETLDGLLKEGQVLLAKPADPQYTVDSPLHIYSPLEAKVKRWHKVDDVSFQLELGEKYYVAPPAITEEGPPPDMTMDTFRAAMKKFFTKHRFCLIKVAGTYKMVWRSRGVYFVLDLYGRKPEDLETDKEHGKVMLICLKALDNVVYLINNLSGIQPTDPFNMRELKVVKMTGTDGKTMSRDFGKREHQYQVISEEYAVLKGETHLLRNSSDPIRTRSALPVGVAALLAAKIDHPATWNERMVEKIICYGVNVCVCCWEQCLQAKEPIDIERFPNRLKIAQFKARYTLIPRKFTGIWKCVPNFKQTELEAALITSFEAGDNNLLVQIDQNIYAIFKKNNFFYLFDPYRHRIDGLPIPSGEENAVVKRYSTLRMFRSLETFLKVFTQMLLETNSTTQFAIHTLKINNIELSVKETGPAQDEPILNEDFEVKSLNETLCFEEDETKCKLDLGGEDEDEEDVTSGIVQMEMPERSETEESEEELEEEEGGLEDLGEYESSSSGDGHRHGKGRRKRSKGRKRGGRKDGGGGGGKGKKKSGKGKGKKGKAKGDKTDKLKKGKKKKGDKSEKSKKDKDKKDRENKDKKKKGKKGKDESDAEKDKKKSDKDQDKSKEKSDKEKSDKEKAEKDRLDKEKAEKDKADKEKSDMDKDKDKEKADKDKDKDKDKDIDKDKDKDKDKGKDRESDILRGDSTKRGDEDRGKHAEGSQTGDRETGDRRGSRDGRDGRHRPGAADDRSSFGRTGSSCGDERRDRDIYPLLTCKPNDYPGYSSVAYDMAVVGSESGTYESICKLLRAGFKCADRILTMTPWGNYVAFRGRACRQRIYFLFDGCTCNVNRFRHLDLNCGTAGLLDFDHIRDLVCYILDSRRIRSNLKKSRKKLVDEICRQYC
uniref:Uncharacterized protein n=1 Tax=Ceratitis capitata TaxID=7213 RepID=W8BAH2_CERCA